MFICVPILTFSLLQSDLICKRKEFLFKTYMYGIISVTLLLIVIALTCLYKNYNFGKNLLENFKTNFKCFFTVDFSRFEHPTYLGMKISWTFILLWQLFARSFKKLINILIIILLTIVIFLLASKGSIILWTVLILCFLFSFINEKISNKIYKYSTIILISFILFAGSFSVAKEIVRINQFLSQIKTGLTRTEVNWKDLDQRTREWYCALQLIKEKPIFGHGIGRVEDRMVEEYLKNRWEEEARLRYNAHNQFLETQMTFGIPGTLSLLWMLFTPLIFRKRLMYPKLATAFVFMMTFFLMFESMFVRQWGIMFFTLFYCILVFPSKEENNIPVNHTELKNY